MPIRPVDYINTISKTQEISKGRQLENNKIKTQVEQRFVQQEKQIEKNIKMVRHANKSENLRVDVDNRKRSSEDKDERKNKKNKKNKEDKNQNKIKLGDNIDIKI